MKKILKLTLAIALLMGSTSLFAQKFGRINTQEIIMSMPETKTPIFWDATFRISCACCSVNSSGVKSSACSG